MGLRVVKVGGSILRLGLTEDFAQDLKDICAHERVVIVHGGASAVTSMAEKMSKDQKFVVSPDGMKSRYTDRETMDIFIMVMAGKLNKEVVANLLSHGLKAVGLSGIDGGLLNAERKKRLIVLDERGRKVAIDGGYTGKISKVKTSLLEALLDREYIPVVAPIALSEEFDPLNVDSDRAAAYVAGALKADSLILCTDVQGLILNGSTVGRLSKDQAIKEVPEIGHGMKKKVYAAIEALEQGVGETIITSGLIKKPITDALAHQVGTLIVPG